MLELYCYFEIEYSNKQDFLWIEVSSVLVFVCFKTRLIILEYAGAKVTKKEKIIRTEEYYKDKENSLFFFVKVALSVLFIQVNKLKQNNIIKCNRWKQMNAEPTQFKYFIII